MKPVPVSNPAEFLERLSHPERLFWQALERCGYVAHLADHIGWPYLRKDRLVVLPQVAIVEGIATDYAFSRLNDANDLVGVSLAVEIDGFEYHERTQQQAAEDRRRDRILLRAGSPTMRFMALEVMRDADGCVLEVERYMLGSTSTPESK